MSLDACGPAIETETDEVLLRRTFQHLAAISAAARRGLAEPEASLLEIPEPRILELIRQMRDGLRCGWPSATERSIWALLCRDRRVAVRLQVAVAAATVLAGSLQDAERVLGTLTRDRAPEVRREATRSFVELLGQLVLVDRVELVCRWAMSGSATQRAAVARALSTPISAAVTEWVIEHLSADPDSLVRRCCLRAAAEHYTDNPHVYRRVAFEHALDPDRRVRRSARRLLRRTKVLARG